MSCRKIVRIILSLLVFTLLLPSLKAEASTKSVLVSYRRETFPLVITVSGHGILKDGDEEIRNGSVEYNLLYGTRKEFVIQAEPGYKLTGLSYKRPEIDQNESIDILSRVDADGKFWIVVEDTKIELTAIFEKIDDGSGGGTGNTGGTSSKPSSKPSTGTSGTAVGSGSHNSTTSVTGTSSGKSTRTGDTSAAEWYLLIMLLAAVVIGSALVKQKVYRKPSRLFIECRNDCKNKNKK